MEFQRPSKKASASPCSGDLHDFFIDSPSITIPLLFRHATPIPTGLEKPVKDVLQFTLRLLFGDGGTQISELEMFSESEEWGGKGVNIVNSIYFTYIFNNVIEFNYLI